MRKRKRNATICFVYDSIVQSNFRLLLYIIVITVAIISLSGVITPAIFLLCIPLLFCIARLSTFGVFNSEGIKVYTFLVQPFFLPWKTITDYGTVVKKTRFETNTYMYFSDKELVTAPYEPMPKLSNSVVYFTVQPRLKKALLQHWNCVKTRAQTPDADIKKNSRKSMLHFCVGFYFVWLFRVLFALSKSHIWIYLMILPSVYIFVGVIWEICTRGRDLP